MGGVGGHADTCELELQKEADTKPEWRPPSMKLGTNPTVKNFETFWKPFRAALLGSDTDELRKVTRFPLRASEAAQLNVSRYPDQQRIRADPQDRSCLTWEPLAERVRRKTC